MAAIRNVYDLIKKDAPQLLHKADNPNKHLHNFDLPFRMVVVAPSGSGKSNLLVNMIMLFCEGKGTFSKINIVTRDKSEPLYDWIASKSASIVISEGLSSLPKLDAKTYDKDSNSLLVIDDLVLSRNLDAVSEVYIRGRKLGISVVFISQSYFKIPSVIRQNCSYLVLLRLSCVRDARFILSELSLGVTKDQLMDLYEYATDTKFSPLIVDLAAPKQSRFRKGFSEIIPVE
jgi:hypothetical protein